MSDFERLINASDLIEWIMETFPDWCVGAVRSIVDHVEALPSAQPKERTEERTEMHACDLIDREAAVDAIYHHLPSVSRTRARTMLHEVPSAQPEVILCKDCIYYDPPHVENNGVRYEYDEMPADAFDALGTGLVNAEYGINIGGRCCVDYYCKNYSDDKRVFVREDNYCGRAERRTDANNNLHV